MIDFKEEIKKYSPILSVDDVENSIKSDDVQDFQELLQILSKNIKEDKE